MKCFIYRNLHKEGCVYSVRVLEGEFKGRIIGYASGIILNDVVFKVSKAGRDRVRRERKKNVHAGIVGKVVKVHDYEQRLCEFTQPMIVPLKSTQPYTPVKYNPYENDTFIDKKNGQPVYTATQVIIDGNSVKAIGLNR